MNQTDDKNKWLGKLIIIILALAGGPLGWIFLLIWFFTLINKNNRDSKSKRGFLKDIYQANDNINDTQLSDINGQISLPNKNGLKPDQEIFRIAIILISLLGIAGIIVYLIIL